MSLEQVSMTNPWVIGATLVGGWVVLKIIKSSLNFLLVVSVIGGAAWYLHSIGQLPTF